MKYVFENIKNGEKIIREKSDNLPLEENWTGNMLDGWAIMIVRSQWIDDGKLDRFADISELMFMPEEKRRKFCEEVRKEKMNLRFDVLEKSFEEEGDEFRIDPSLIDEPIENLYIEPSIESSMKLKKRQ